MTGFTIPQMNDIVQQCWDDSGKWFPINRNTAVGSQEHVTFLLLALGGEMGEAMNVWKKYLRGSADEVQTLPMLREELIDVFIYFCNLVKALDIDVQKEYDAKRAYNQSRFGK